MMPMRRQPKLSMVSTSSEADDSVVTHTREKCEYAGRESSVEDDQYET